MALTKRPESRYWYSRFQINGRSYLISTGETDRRRAAQEDARLQQEKRAEQSPNQPTGIGTLAALAAADVAAAIERGTSPINYQAVQERWGRVLNRLGANTPPEAINDEQILGYINLRRKEGLRGQSIRKEVAGIRRALEDAEQRGWIAKVPKIPRIPSDDKDPKQAGKLIAPETVRAVLKEASPDAAIAAEFCVLTGLRFAEITRMRWSFVADAPHGSKAAAILRLPSEATKNRKMRTVGLSKRALEIARSRVKEVGDQLFPHRHYSQALKRACKRLHLPHSVTMRDLRHTFASNALKASGDLSAVSEALGHSEVETTALYLHSTQQDVIDLAAHMDAKFVSPKLYQSQNRITQNGASRRKQIGKMERETGIEPATSCLGSTSDRVAIEFSAAQAAANHVKKQQSMHTETVSVAVSGSLPVSPGEYPRIHLICGACEREQDQEQAPGYECLFCGSHGVVPLVEAEEIVEDRDGSVLGLEGQRGGQCEKHS